MKILSFYNMLCKKSKQKINNINVTQPESHGHLVNLRGIKFQMQTKYCR
uniref:Uncharacterized protein n=1 Tax=Rhizophora mucronata TaxID=61149 RepID=A0A2P2PB88_RHIMU